MTPAPACAAGLAALEDMFTARGLVRVEPPVLQPAGVFLDLSGEDIRRRLFLVQDPEGRELCLRPDYTIPVSLMHLEHGSAPGPAGYCYLGPVFRYRQGAADSGETIQAGVERFADADAEEADADVVGLALDVLSAFGVARPEIRLGDSGLFMAFVAALDLPEPWPRRLRAGFGREGGLMEALDAAPSASGVGAPGFLAGLARSDPQAARAAVEEMVSMAGIVPVGGRSPQEIAERLVEQAALAAGEGLCGRARDVLREVAQVRGRPREALERLDRLARRAGFDVSAALGAFDRRLGHLAARGVRVDDIRFAADFGRRLDYYTGFVFEMHRPGRTARQLAGGGRYDRLLTMLGARNPVPAVGCAVWLDRLGSGEGA